MNAAELLDLGGGRRTPCIRQVEASECGLACLAMTAAYHGLKVDMPTLRRRFPMSLKGATLKTLIGVAEQVGFSPRPLRVDIEALDQLPLPAILHWDLNHFVVLARVTRRFGKRRYHIHDPATGSQTIGPEELSRHFTGVVLELAKAEKFIPRAEQARLRITQLWSNMSGLWLSLRQVILLSLVLQTVALATPFYLQLAVDTAFPSFDLDLLKMLAIGFAGLMLINMITGWLRSVILVSLGSSLSYQVIGNLYRHLLRLPLSWFQKRHVGDILSRFSSTRPISDLLSQGLIAAMVDGLMAFLTLAMMFVYAPLLAWVAVVAWLLFAALKIGFVHALRMRSIDAITAAAKENSSFIESIRGVTAIKAFGQEGNRQRIWQQLKADSVNADIKLGRTSAAFHAGGQFILGAERVLFVYLAIGMAMEGSFTVGMIFAFQAYKQQFLDASTRLIEQAVQYKLLDVHLNRIADIALSPSEPSEDTATPGRGTIRGEISLRSVGFRYGAGEPEVLRGVNVEIAQGELIALVGPSGGGKTTLLKIMMGLLEPNYGEVRVDDRPVASLGLTTWRRNIGTVMQDDNLYAGSLAENIAFFDPEIDMDRVAEAATLAAIAVEIEQMPMGYETLVGDMGSALSGGQKQRVLLARALYPNPSVLFMDEGTAHLDPASESAVMQAIAALPITRIVSTHRPMAVERSDGVLVVMNGAVRRLAKISSDAQSSASGTAATPNMSVP